MPKVNRLPYAPEKGIIQYVVANNPFMRAAQAYACKYSLDATMPTGSIIVLHNRIVGRGANGSDYHKSHECERVKRGSLTGQDYELCPGCHPHNHSEVRAIENALILTEPAELSEAILYLWGHWWCCKDCWDQLLAVDIKLAYLLEQSEVLFNKLASGNIVGKQCMIQL